MQKIPMTKEGFVVLSEELKHLKSVERPSIIEQIAAAREHGDLKENAEYHASREKQSFIEGQIKELEAIISRVQVIDVQNVQSDTVIFGATVEIADESDKVKVYQIVGEKEASINHGKISFNSPVAKGLIGKKVGDVVNITAPGGIIEYEIISIKFK